MKKWAGRLVKIGFFLFAFMAIILTVMVNMGGNNDNLKGAIEDYLAGRTGYATNITTLNKMSFYPYIIMDVEGIEMRRAAGSEIAVNAQSAKLSFGFWDLFLGRRQLRDLNVQNIVMTAGAVLDQRIEVKSLQIDEEADGQAFASLKGKIGADDIDIRIGMQTSGKPGRYRYGIGEESAVDATIGNLDFQGIMRPRALGGFHLRDFTLSHNAAQVATGTLSVLRNKADLNVEGPLEIGSSKGAVELDFASAEDVSVITGTAQGDMIAPQDFTKDAPVSMALKEWQRIFANKNRINQKSEVNVTAASGGFTGLVTKANGALVFTPQKQTNAESAAQ